MASMIDLHVHTTASDGTDTPEELVRKAVLQGLRVFSVTDHDTIDGSRAAARLVPPQIRYIRGIEFTCICPGGKCHILGYGYDPADPVFREALETGHRLRVEKLERRIVFLREQFGIVLTAEEERQLRSEKSPGKPNVAKILVQRGLAPDLKTAIRTFIDPCKGGADRIDAASAIRAITHAGGIPVWAHPLGGEGERRLTPEQFEMRLQVLLDAGICGLECFYSRYSRADIDFLLDRAETHGLLVSGGSDYHGSNKVGVNLAKLNEADECVEARCLTVLDRL